MITMTDTNTHAGHDLAALRQRRPDGPVGRLVCLDCDQIVGPLALCGRPTRTGAPCTVGVRRDLGHETCWSHGEGAGRTNALQRRGPRGAPLALGAGYRVGADRPNV